MKQLYSARNGLEAHDLRLFLESQGIAARVFGDNNALEIGFAFTPASAPGVFVDEADFERATERMEQFFDREHEPQAEGTWTCATCGETVDGQFEICWNCEAPRGDASIESADSPAKRSDSATPAATPPSESAAPQSSATPPSSYPVTNRDIWLEVAVVLAVSWLPYFASTLFFDSTANSWNATSFISRSAWSMLHYFSIIAVVLYVMYRSGQPWSIFGIRPFRPIADPSWGVIIWLLTVIAMVVVQTVVIGIWGNVASRDYSQTDHGLPYPSATIEVLVLVMFALSTGLSEELAMRGYLIPRLERLLNSSGYSVLISSALFASYHLYQGIDNCAWIFVMGVTFGTLFCRIRRLWPLVIAHSMMDLIAMWPRG